MAAAVLLMVTSGGQVGAWPVGIFPTGVNGGDHLFVGDDGSYHYCFESVDPTRASFYLDAMDYYEQVSNVDAIFTSTC
ncbi:MAG: hypothetical protein WBF71_08500, partial [Microthrixaceae bacterium]